MIKNEVLNYIPKLSVNLVKNLIKEENLTIKIVKIRKTKHGDFKKFINGSSQITLNLIENKYRFFICLANFESMLSGKIELFKKGSINNL